jgi:hypothetical protein
MAEIKSTIDLVMERTRNLTMSDEDRRRQATAELMGSVNRLTQKYLDGELDVERFRSEFDRLEGSAEGKSSVVSELAKRLNPGGDNVLLLDLLKRALGTEISGTTAILENCRKKMESETGIALDRMRKELLQKDISGSAVVPHVERDTGLVEKRGEILENCMRELQSEISRVA